MGDAKMLCSTTMLDMYIQNEPKYPRLEEKSIWNKDNTPPHAKQLRSLVPVMSRCMYVL